MVDERLHGLILEQAVETPIVAAHRKKLTETKQAVPVGVDGGKLLAEAAVATEEQLAHLARERPFDRLVHLRIIEGATTVLVPE